MKRVYCVVIMTTLSMIMAFFVLNALVKSNTAEKQIKFGFIYVGDESDAYTGNFIRAQEAVEKEFGDKVQIIVKYNIVEGQEEEALSGLVEEGCDLIFTTSYGFGESAKRFAEEYPDIEFCQATCSNANEEPVLKNYHTFMGAIYQGRYVAGVAAGMKLRELIDSGKITPEQAKIGYVGAFPYAEVISGYTSFFLGVRSEVPEATMIVKYTNSWSDYTGEKKVAKELIEEGCVIISQHSDTAGPAVACEETDASQIVYHVGYSQDMTDVAPTTYLTGCKINWEPYISAAISAVLSDKKIESCVKGNICGNDAGAGFDRGWVEMLELNNTIAAKGTKERIEELTEQFKKGEITVFKGDYTGRNPYDPTDVIDLRNGYIENQNSSAPTFGYVLDDVIVIE